MERYKYFNDILLYSVVTYMFTSLCIGIDDGKIKMNYMLPYHSISRMTDVSSSSPPAGSDISFYLTVYGCLAGANSLFTLCRAFLFAFGGICAAQVIHKHLLSSVLKVGLVTFKHSSFYREEGRKCFYLTMHSTHFPFYSYMASDMLLY